MTHSQEPNDAASPAADTPPEIYILTDQKLGGTISPEDLKRLEELLRTNSAARRHYLLACAVEGFLPEALADEESHVDSSRPAIPFSKPIPFFRRVSVIASVAVLAVILSGAFFLLRPAPATPPLTAGSAPLCRVASVLGATVNQQRIDAFSELPAGIFTIDTGAAELVFGQGARVLLEAPASLEIIGTNACKLIQGKAVADVPDSAKGFVMEGPHGRIIDYGTRFATSVDPQKGRSFVGVLSGVVDVEQSGKTLRLYSDYAMEYRGQSAQSVPLDRSEFLTEMPARELPWNLDGTPMRQPQTLRFNVTSLMKAPGDNVGVFFKWLDGVHGLTTEEISLSRNGERVADLRHIGRAGVPENTYNNAVTLQLPPGTPTDGQWELVVKAVCGKNSPSPDDAPVSSRGVFLCERGLSTGTTYADFIGRWSYSHNNAAYVREFLADGTCKIYIDGQEHVPPGGRLRCEVTDGVLSMIFADPQRAPEKVVLRDRSTLIFLNRPYRNACRL